jgi:hypothetical protein
MEVYGPRFTKETKSEATVALYIWLKYMNGRYWKEQVIVVYRDDQVY